MAPPMVQLYHNRKIHSNSLLFKVSYTSEDEELYELWKDRLEYIMHEFSGFGWGMDDFIAGEYYSLPWIEED